MNVSRGESSAVTVSYLEMIAANVHGLHEEKRVSWIKEGNVAFFLF